MPQFISDLLDEFITLQITPRISDVLEMIIIAYVIYHILVWVKNTRTWFLLKGLLFLLIFFGIATILEFNTILYIAKNSLNIIVMALVVVFQPELRTALEQLGKENVLMKFFSSSSSQVSEGDEFSEKTIEELVKACYALGRTRTGALIVIERELPLVEYIKTGIEVDAVVTSQLLINIFEHNTPLHDGAVVLRGNRVVSATCYLPLSQNSQVSKDLGTRHRAALGVSEVTDSLTLIVSEETGRVSVASAGSLKLGLTAEELREELRGLQKPEEEGKKRLWRWRRRRNEEQTIA